jgi:hypothetical protein
MAVLIFFAGFMVGAMFGSYLSSSFQITAGQILLGCVGVVGLAAPIYNSWIARSHNRLQVRPLLMYQQIIETENNNDFIYSVSIINNGLGPAIIDACEYVYDDKKINTATDLSIEIVDTLQNHIAYRVSCGHMTTEFINKDIISTKEDHMVLKCVFTLYTKSSISPDIWNEISKIVRDELGKLTIKISYRCAYHTLSKVELKSS